MDSRRKPYVFVTLEGPDDGGDFGPNTPRTKTGGIQEALNYAHENYRDVYIWGGRGGFHAGSPTHANVYTLDETVEVPWNQDFRLDGGNYHLTYTKTTGDAIVIDSQMNCRYKFGLISSRSDGAVVRIKPRSSGPDDLAVVTASTFDFCALVGSARGIGAHRVDRASKYGGTGLVLDSSNGPIIHSKILADETNTLGRGVYLTDAGGEGSLIANNFIQVMYNNQYHVQYGACTNVRVGDPGTNKIVHNKIDMSLHAPRGSNYDAQARKYVTPDEFWLPDENAIGADIFAQRNFFTLASYGKRVEGRDILFEPDAQENTVFALNLPNGITNKARVPTNRVITNWPVGFRVATPPFPPSAENLVNTTSYTIQAVILDSGKVSDWTLTDSGATAQTHPFNLAIIDNLKRMGPAAPSRIEPVSQTVSGGLAAGQAITLEPGESIRFTYSEAPTWRWRALR